MGRGDNRLVGERWPPLMLIGLLGLFLLLVRIESQQSRTIIFCCGTVMTWWLGSGPGHADGAVVVAPFPPLVKPLLLLHGHGHFGDSCWMITIGTPRKLDSVKDKRNMFVEERAKL